MSSQAMLAAWAVLGEIPSAAARLVLLRLAFRANERGEAWPGAEGLARDCGLGERTVRTAVALLEETGRMMVERRKDRAGRNVSNRYLLPVMKIQEGEFAEAPPQGPGSASPPANGAGAPASAAGEKTREKKQNSSLWVRDEFGIFHQPGNVEDQQMLKIIYGHPPQTIQKAAQEAEIGDVRGRAFPSAVARLLTRKTAGRGAANAWAVVDDDEEEIGGTSGVAAPEALEGQFEIVEGENHGRF